jgi:localization factor PodJL
MPAAWGGDSTETASVDMGKAIRNIQAILNNNGFDAGAPDGVMGKRTVAAIKAFQSSIGMEPTGEIDDRLVKELLERNG